MTTMIRKQIYLEPQQDDQIKQLAEERGTTEADIIRTAVDLLLANIQRRRRSEAAGEQAPMETVADLSETRPHTQLAKEQAAWYALSETERTRYQGEYVAIYQGQVVDHDPDQRALYIRIRAQYGHVPVPILSADWDEPPTYIMRSPRLVQV